MDIDYYFNGFIFNKIPLLKKLKLREVIIAKILYGGVRLENNTDIFKLLHLDYLKRLTYLNYTEVTEWGVRTRVKMDF